MSDNPIRVSIRPAIEHDSAMPLQAGKSVRIGPAIERDTAMPLQVRRTVGVPLNLSPAAGVGGGSLTISVASTSPLSPRPLTAEEHTIVGLVAQLGATFAAMRGASPELMLFVGLVLYLLLREFTRRCLPPSG